MPRSDTLNTLKHLAEELRFFRPDHAVIYRTACGCLDVLGGLGAESGGTLAQMTLPARVAVAAQARGDAQLVVRSGQIAPPLGDSHVTLPLECIAGRPENEVVQRMASFAGTPAAWAAPLLALWWRLQSPASPPGASILIHGEIPLGAGQASSTALLAATALSLGDLQNRALPAPLAVAHWVSAAESLTANPGADSASGTSAVLTPAQTHIIAAQTSLHARESHSQLLRYSAQPHRFAGPVPLPQNVRVLALDTGVRYARVRVTLEELYIAAAMGMRIIETIYRDLGQPHTPLHGYLANTSPLLYRQYFRSLLPRRLRGSDFVRTYGPTPQHLFPDAAEEIDGARLYRVRTAVDHLIAENEHAEQFLQAMEELAETGSAALHPAERQRTLARAGRLLLASHHSYRLRLELSCREADWLVDRLMESGPERGIYGARITGAGGGGTVAALLDRSPAATDALLEVLKSYNQVTGLTLGITEA